MKIKILFFTFFLVASVGLYIFSQQINTHKPKETKLSTTEIKEEVVETFTGLSGTELSVILLLSVLGFFETGYLLRTRLTAKPAVCPIGNHKSCTVVLESTYNTTLGIHNDLLGFLYYTTIVLFSFFLWYGLGPVNILREALTITVAGGAVMSLYLTYLQARVLKAWCFWCLTSAFTTWLLTLFILQYAIFV